MKIIAGQHGGRSLRVPPGRPFRPTQGRVRRVLFDLIGERIVGQCVLDLFAGSGALGLEALSRGAASVCFVEQDRVPLRCLKENAERLGVADQCTILEGSVLAGLERLVHSDHRFGWILADPPYDSRPEAWMQYLTARESGVLLETDGVLVLETSKRTAIVEAVGSLVQYRVRTIGETDLRFYRWGGAVA